MSVQVSNISPVVATGAREEVPYQSQPQAAVPQPQVTATPVAAASEPDGMISVSSGDLQKAVDSLNAYFSGVRRDLKFSVATDLGMPIVAVVDAATGAVLWQVPSQQALRAAHEIDRSGHYLKAQA